MAQPGSDAADRKSEGVGPMIDWAREGVAIIVSAAVFLIFFAGFAMGRRIGKLEGTNLGAKFAPLELRRETWEKGYCVICGSGAVGEETREQSVESSLR